ncbi:hypothetical protein [Vibrio casei]|uniref:hypothetical protein n=1 Tax=Vibrio casei TaxID=673372 RepID=UPI000B5C6C3C|nr:hypothetical protein [Vibrio casei]
MTTFIESNGDKAAPLCMDGILSDLKSSLLANRSYFIAYHSIDESLEDGLDTGLVSEMTHYELGGEVEDLLMCGVSLEEAVQACASGDPIGEYHICQIGRYYDFEIQSAVKK